MSWGYQTRRGEEAPNARLTQGEAEEIRERYQQERCTMRKLAEQYGVSEGTIRRVVTGQSYS